MADYSPITVARFWSKVKVLPSEMECWEWTGARKELGYGRFNVAGRKMTASRVAWEIFHGEALGERHALHSCDNPCCCNPMHIRPGTHAENMREAHDRKRVRRQFQVGERNNAAKLREADVVEILGMISDGMSNLEIAAHFGVSDSMISRIRGNKSWTNIPRTKEES